MNLTASAFPFAPYIHKSVIIAPLLVPAMLLICVFLHLSALVSKQGREGEGQGWGEMWLFKTFKFICVSCESLYRCHLPPGEEWHAHSYVHTHTHTHLFPGFIQGLSRATVPLDPFYSSYKQTNKLGPLPRFSMFCGKVSTLFQGGCITFSCCLFPFCRVFCNFIRKTITR